MKTIIRAFIVIIVIYATVMAVMGLQYMFDRGDMKKAAKVIYEFKPSHTVNKTLAELMAQNLGVTPEELHCETELISRYEGRVLVECGDKKSFQPENTDLNFHFVVDVVRGSVDGKNEKARKLIATQF